MLSGNSTEFEDWNFLQLPKGPYAFVDDREIRILNFKKRIQYY